MFKLPGPSRRVQEGAHEPKLTKVACQHLQIFIAVCSRTVQLRESKLAKVKMFVSVFFSEDKIISGLLQQMKVLADKERGLVASLNLRYAVEATRFSREAAENTRDFPAGAKTWTRSCRR